MLVLGLLLILGAAVITAGAFFDAGETATVELALDERSFARWDPGLPERAELAKRATAVPMAGTRAEGRPPGWRVDAGRYALHVGTSSAAIAHVAAVDVTAPPS